MQDFNRGKFENRINRIAELYEYYKTNNGRDNVYTITLANGENIRYGFKPNNISHLLGINFEELKLQRLITGESTEEMLNSLLNNIFAIGNKIKEGSLKESSIFSNYIDDKLDGFKDNLCIPFPKDIKFICKYNREINYTNKIVDGITGEYIIARENENNDIVLLVLKQMYDDNKFILAPQSCRIIRNDEKMGEKLSDLLRNQTITYITNTGIKNDKTGYENNIYPNIFQTETILNTLNELAQGTGAIACTIGGHRYNLRGLINIKRVGYNSQSVNNYIKEKINNGEMIILTSEAKEQLNETELQLINNYNNNIVNTNEDGKLAYSRLNDDYIKVCEINEATKEELESIKEQLRILQEESKKKDEEIIKLSQTKDEYNNLVDQINSIAKTLERK